ncbi:MAG TPA: SRPBCC family protein [Trebonia sp.]|jgi:hypothetical protein|nr:SRPBCC family protein [Trebonia sp.]
MRGPSPDEGSISVVRTETILCEPAAFLEFVLDIEGYAKVDDKIVPVLWSRRDGDVVQFACRPKIAGLRLPKVEQIMRLTPGERIDIALTPLPANRLGHAVARFEASFACRAVPGGTEVVRSLQFRFTPGFRWLLAPLFRRRLPAEVQVEMARARQHFAAGTSG